jgi:hypothetical protein
MFGLFAFIGIVMLLGSIAMLVIYPSLRKEEGTREVESRLGGSRTETLPASHPALLWFNRKKSLTFLIVGLILALNTQFLFYARPGYQYFIVAPTGAKYAVFTSGVKMVMPLSRIQEWQKFVDIKVVVEGESSEGVEGVIRDGIPIRFIDQVTAQVRVSTRMQMPTDEASFVKLAEEFRLPLNLVNNTLVPTVREQVINTGYMFAAQDYISGSAADFRMTLDEQLKDGGYSVEKTVHYDTLFSSIGSMKERTIAQINTTYEVTKREKNGIPIRNEHDITKNNIIVSQVIVDEVQLNPEFKKRLEAQRDESAKRQLEQQKVKTAKDAQARIIAEGERDKSAEKVKQELAQVATVTAVETRAKAAKFQEVEEQNLLAAAKVKAERIRVAADADAYEISRKVQAGITPERRLEMELDAKVKIAAEIAKLKLPSTFISGGSDGGNNGSGLLEVLIGAEMAKNLLPATK